MPPNSREAGYLWDMLQAARRLNEAKFNPQGVRERLMVRHIQR